MAIPCQGFTFTWGGATLSEVQSLEADVFGGTLPLGRTIAWTPAVGVVRLSGFSIANMPTSDYGLRKRLTITAPIEPSGSATLLDVDAIYSGYQAEATANDAVRFAVTFTLQDTVGAPT